MKTHKTHIDWLTCKEHGHKYPFPNLGEQSYGLFVLRSKNLSFRFLNTFAETQFDEVSSIFKKLFNISGRTNSEQSSMFQDIYGPSCCDLDEFDNYYNIRWLLKRPYCQNPDAPEHDLALSYDKSSAEIPYVTHEKWDRLTDAEKVARVDQVLCERGHLNEYDGK